MISKCHALVLGYVFLKLFVNFVYLFICNAMEKETKNIHFALEAIISS